MKIQINPNESYEFIIPESIKREEFIGLVDRFNRIVKLLGKDVFESSISSSNETPLIKKKYTKSGTTKINLNTREEIVELVKMYYAKDKTPLIKWENEHNTTRINIASYVKSKKIKFNIQPEEVGLVEFPKKGEGKAYARLQ